MRCGSGPAWGSFARGALSSRMRSPRQMERALCPLLAHVHSRQNLARSSSEPRRKDGAEQCIRARTPKPVLLMLATLPEMPYWGWLRPDEQDLPWAASQQRGWLAPTGTRARIQRGHTLTNFLSIFALMSLARVKNACGISMSLVPWSREQTGACWFRATAV